MHLRPTWRGASTNKQVILFFQRNTLEHVIPYLLSDRMLLDEDRQALLEKLNSYIERRIQSEIANYFAERGVSRAALGLSEQVLQSRSTRIPHERDFEGFFNNLKFTELYLKT